MNFKVTLLLALGLVSGQLYCAQAADASEVSVEALVEQDMQDSTNPELSGIDALEDRLDYLGEQLNNLDLDAKVRMLSKGKFTKKDFARVLQAKLHQMRQELKQLTLQEPAPVAAEASVEATKKGKKKKKKPAAKQVEAAAPQVREGLNCNAPDVRFAAETPQAMVRGCFELAAGYIREHNDIPKGTKNYCPSCGKNWTDFYTTYENVPAIHAYVIGASNDDLKDPNGLVADPKAWRGKYLKNAKLKERALFIWKTYVENKTENPEENKKLANNLIVCANNAMTCSTKVQTADDLFLPCHQDKNGVWFVEANGGRVTLADLNRGNV